MKYLKLIGAVAGLCAIAQATVHHWWLGLFASLFYLVKGFYEGWQDEKRLKAARTWTPLSSQEARWQLRQDRWHL